MIVLNFIWIMALLCKGALIADASPRCYRDLENRFFERQPLIEALSYTEIQSGLWELIASDLRAKTPTIHQEVLKRARLKKRDPTQYPFQMKQSKEILDKVLFEYLQETIRRYKYVFIREGDIVRIFAFLKAAHQVSWDLCR